MVSSQVSCQPPLVGLNNPKLETTTGVSLTERTLHSSGELQGPPQASARAEQRADANTMLSTRDMWDMRTRWGVKGRANPRRRKMGWPVESNRYVYSNIRSEVPYNKLP